jgi:hypothetical protein
MRSRALRLGVLLAQQPRGPSVSIVALDAREPFRDHAAHDRMREGDRVLLAEDRGMHEPSCQLAGAARLEADEQGGVPERAAVTDHAHRSGQQGRIRCDSREPCGHVASQSGRRDVLHAVRVALQRKRPFGCERALKLEQIQGVAAAGAAAGIAERRADLAAERVCEQRGTGAVVERGDLAGRAHRLTTHVVEEFGLGARGARPHGHEYADRQRLDPTGQVREKAQRMAVGPLPVVERQHQRRSHRQLAREQIERMQDAEGRVLAGRRCPRHARERELRRLVHDPVLHRARPFALQPLPHDAVRVLGLELIRAR